MSSSVAIQRELATKSPHPFTQRTLRSCIPIPQSFEQLPYGPTSQPGIKLWHGVLVVGNVVDTVVGAAVGTVVGTVVGNVVGTVVGTVVSTVVGTVVSTVV
eukprot:CAMPEP_0115742402 /NCGR_PEP_ID=MMETSP0272-20121206/90511_1 /TAXON_ID=71861 /ORGANISM="Scrippsiella trochoidea, Strain CCMP3099" /LENGTH=100 /DNA_ID=CAMNT_0003187127 /DNA_START=268 /DNA_END=567 /DNA_ORIENTATION=-